MTSAANLSNFNEFGHILELLAYSLVVKREVATSIENIKPSPLQAYLNKQN